MPAIVQTRPARCATHGQVNATRTLPPLKFPIFVTGIRRLIALTGAYRCPVCGAKCGAKTRA
jgi:hypothetical protein